MEPGVVIWLSDDMSFHEVALVQISIFSIVGLDVFAYHAKDQSRVRFLSNAAASNDYIDYNAQQFDLVEIVGQLPKAWWLLGNGFSLHYLFEARIAGDIFFLQLH